jgi:hypothetical protein
MGVVLSGQIQSNGEKKKSGSTKEKVPSIGAPRRN